MAVGWCLQRRLRKKKKKKKLRPFPSMNAGISGKRTMGRQRRMYQRRADDGKAAVDGHRREWGYIVKFPHPMYEGKEKKKIPRTRRRWPCANGPLFSPTKAKIHGVWKFNNITPAHPSHRVDTYCTKERSTAHGHQRKVRRIFVFVFLLSSRCRH
jgi:hypothetical protein